MKLLKITQSLPFHLAIRIPLLLLVFSPFLSNAQFGPQNIISPDELNAFSVSATDLDGDGDLDVLSGFHAGAGTLHKIAWYENVGGGVFASQSIISTDPVPYNSVYAADLNGDGDMDVLSSSGADNDAKIAWYENMGVGVFASQSIISADYPGAGSVYAADLDGDGDVDVLSATYSYIAWYENMGGGVFSGQSIISENNQDEEVYAADLDGDGDMDVLSGSGSNVSWFENMGSGVFASQSIISTDVVWVNSIYASDLDADGDLDVLSGSGYDADAKIAWYENMGNGVFASQSIISTDVNSVFSVHAADFDGDGNMDVLSGSQGEIIWYENTGGGVFADQSNIYTNLNEGGHHGYAADLDGDGDMDVLSALGGKAAWFENQSPTAIFALDESTNQLQVYPNPTTGIINLDLLNPEAGEYLISIVDVFGKTAYRTTTQMGSAGNMNLDLSQFAEGSYFLNLLHLKQGIRYSEKVLIQR